MLAPRRSRPGSESPRRDVRRTSPDHQEEEEGQRHQEERRRLGEQRVEVEADPADHEEDRDQEPEPDALEPLDGAAVGRVVAAAQEHPGDESRDERAEQDVETEVPGDPRQCQHEQHRDPDPQLAAGLEGVRQQPDDPRRPGTQGREEHDGRGHREEQQHPERVAEALARQQEGDGEDGPELAHRAGGEHEGPEPRVQVPVVAEDGQERAERRGGEDQPDQHARRDTVLRGAEADDEDAEPDAQHERGEPRRAGGA